LGRWEDEKVGKKRPGSWEARKPGGQKEKSGAHRAWRIARWAVGDGGSG